MSLQHQEGRVEIKGTVRNPVLRKFTFYLPLLLLTIPLVYGFTISLSGYDRYIREHFPGAFFGGNQVNDRMWEFMNALFPAGGCIGSVVGTYVSPICGKKLLLIIFNSVGILGSILYIISYFFKTFTSFVMARFLFGLSGGLLMTCGLVHASELLIERYKKTALKFPQLLINFGLMVSGILSIEKIIGKIWVLTILPLFFVQVISLLVSIALPESPFFLLGTKKDIPKAKEALIKIRPPGWDIDQELDKMGADLTLKEHTSNVTIWNFIRNPDLYYPILMSCCISAFQQLSGINVVILFASTFSKGVGFEQIDVGIVIMLSFCFGGSAVFFFLTPRLGVKLSMYFGHFVMSVTFFIAYGFSFNPSLAIGSIVFLSLYLVAFQAGPGPLPWVIFFSTFEEKYRPAAQGLLNAVNWGCNLIITAGSMEFTRAVGIHPLLFYAILNLIFGMVFFFFMIETKGKDPEQIIAEYQKKYRTKQE
ncbi:hypothetical protein HZS_7815 [Henneguya salminicola]|nr:hypothetical protein HZS_7815 [Henneguya salminicola]